MIVVWSNYLMNQQGTITIFDLVLSTHPETICNVIVVPEMSDHELWGCYLLNKCLSIS